MDTNLRIRVLEDKLKLFKSFVRHSVKGVKCPSCGNFVPESCKIENKFTCPYPGCGANCNEASPLLHPSCSVAVPSFHLDSPRTVSDGQSDHSGASIKVEYCDGGDTPYDAISKEEDQKIKFRIIHETIESQKKVNGTTRKMPSKQCMYDAFLSVLRSYPVEMIRYICVGGQNGGDFYIQSAIFQEFIKNMSAKLPIIYYSNGDEINIKSLHDERLHIYTGTRQFQNFIDGDLIVRRRSDLKLDSDTYIKDEEECFIGTINSVLDEVGKNITGEIDSYSFTQLKFKPGSKVIAGSSVTVNYNSIQPSYTLGSMIHLQRIKRRIKESSAKKIASFYNTIGLSTTSSNKKES